MRQAAESEGGTGGWLVRMGGRIFPNRLFLGLSGVVCAAFIIRPERWDGVYGQAAFALSLLLIAAGFALRAWGAATAGGHTRSATIEAPALVTGGPYVYVRNPIYLGSIVLGLGAVGLLRDPVMLLLHVATFVCLYVAIIPAEEQFLRGRFGALYETYVQEVPRLVPRLRRWNAAAKSQARWSAARGELVLVGVLAAVCVVLRWAAWLRGVA